LTDADEYERGSGKAGLVSLTMIGAVIPTMSVEARNNNCIVTMTSHD